jgi:hypothetical protein
MGQVVPFIARLRDSGDWTAAERARLQELADRLSASGVKVEVIFGATDEGDPWCVVTDEGGDVLIHVARIDGKFVVHSAADDAVNESADLHAALRDRLAATEEAIAPRSATILPFGLSARQGQTFLALLAATTFFYETASIGDNADAAEPVHVLPDADPPPPAVDADAPAQDRETVAQGVVLQPAAAASGATAVAAGPVAAAAASSEAGEIAPQAPAAQPLAASMARADPPAAVTPAPELKLIEGTAGDDLLVGTSADEHIVGGDGNDTLRGGGGHDLLEGGRGDDVIEITGQSVAIGGQGADTFVVQAPVQLGRADTLLGVIADFSGAEGDRIFNWLGQAVRLTPHNPPGGGEGDKTALPPTTPMGGGDVTSAGGTTLPSTGGGASGGTGGLGPSSVDPSGPPGLTGGPGAQPTPLTRLDVDLDGDGTLDGYLLVAPAETGAQVTAAGRIGPLSRFDVDLNNDGVSDGYILVGPRGAVEVGATSVGVAFSYNDPIG